MKTPAHKSAGFLKKNFKRLILSAAVFTVVTSAPGWAYTTAPFNTGTSFTATTGPTATAAASAAIDINAIASNIVASIADLPTLLAVIAYCVGLHLGVLGVFKIREHVESPNKMSLKNGTIQLACGGGLFALPAILDAMHHTVGAAGASTSQAVISILNF